MYKPLLAAAGILVTLAVSAVLAAPLADAPGLPFSSKRVPASTEECVVWNRERSFARSIEARDQEAWASHFHPGLVMDVGPEPTRGIEASRKVWSIFAGDSDTVLRWRPGTVNMSGNMQAAVSVGPYIFQSRTNGVDRFTVGLYQTVWMRDERDGVWKAIFDGQASTPSPVPDRAAADAWVKEQPMSACDKSSTKP
jgi:ketosteroid isomerase-like protein